MSDGAKPIRKKTRLTEYDYSTPGAYFVTICTKDRENLFWGKASTQAVGAAISRPQEETPIPCEFAEYGRIVDQAVRGISRHYPSVTVDKYVIMPNHVHLLLLIEAAEDGGRLVAAPTLNTVIGQMKQWASRQAGVPLWQKSFYEHIVRNREDYLQIWSYIHDNPVRWREDIYYAE